jgi:hypothetical protein
MKTQLRALTRPQLIALTVQKTGREYQDILTHPNKNLIKILLTVDNVMEPVPA